MDSKEVPNSAQPDIRNVIQEVIREFVTTEQQRNEPAYKAELVEERRRRETLEKRINELAEENRQSRHMALEADKNAAVRSELQRMGVSKIDLAYKAIRDDIQRTEDGRLVAKNLNGELPVADYLQQFIQDNPELLPARITGGSGAGTGQKAPNAPAATLELEKIRPGMSKEDLERARQDIARVALQAVRG